MITSSSTSVPETRIIIDQDNPLYLDSSDSPCMKLVSDPFDGTGFSYWKRSMTIALSARNKLGFVDGTLSKPDATSPTFNSWSCCNAMVMCWLLGSLSETIGDSVMYSNSAHEIWKELEERYGSPRGIQLFGLYKELRELSQGNNSILDYFTKIKMLWNEIDFLSPLPVCTCGGCTCGASTKLFKSQQDQRVMQFLIGLNDSYTSTRGSILMRTPLPSIIQVYRILLQEESLREIHSRLSGFHQSKRPVFDTKKSTLTCTYCKKTGHTVDKCYKLIGFPADFKFTRSKRFAQAAQAEISSSFCC